MLKKFLEIDKKLTQCIELRHNNNDKVDYYEELTIDGDLSLGDIANDNIEALIVNGNLTVNGDINQDGGGSFNPSLVVTGKVTANNLIAIDSHIYLTGDVFIKSMCFTCYNDGYLVIGKLYTPLLIIMHEHATEIDNGSNIELSFGADYPITEHAFSLNKLYSIVNNYMAMFDLYGLEDLYDHCDEGFFIGLASENNEQALINILRDNIFKTSTRFVNKEDLTEKKFYELIRQLDIDPEELSVCADWLQERGDPRGEMIALELTLAHETSEKNEELSKRLKKLRKKNIKRVLNVPDDIYCEVEWNYGFVIGIRVFDSEGVKKLGKIIEPSQLKSLYSLDLNESGLSRLPGWIKNLTQLGVLNLSFNKLSIIPEWIGELDQIKKLDLRDNQIVKLPESIRKLQKLTRLDLSGNKFVKYPDCISDLSQLTQVDLDYNDIEKLPESIGHLRHLRVLNIDEDKLTEIPESLGNLKKLLR